MKERTSGKRWMPLVFLVIGMSFTLTAGAAESTRANSRGKARNNGKAKVADFVLHKAAFEWLNAAFAGNVDELSKRSATPFCLYREMVDKDADLKAKLGEFLKKEENFIVAQRMVEGKITDTRIHVLKGEQKSIDPNKYWSALKKMTLADLELVRMVFSTEHRGRRVGIEFIVAFNVAKPNKKPRVVGISMDMLAKSPFTK